MKPLTLLALPAILVCFGLVFKPIAVLAQPGNGLVVSWGGVDNYAGGSDYFVSELTLSNFGAEMLGDDWAIYFNFIRSIRSDSLRGPISIRLVNGSFYEMKPDSGFALASGESVVTRIIASPWAIRESAAPSGLYVVRKDDVPRPLPDVRIEPFVEPRQFNRHQGDVIPVAAPATRFDLNRRVSHLSAHAVSPIIPTPRELTLRGGFYSLESPVLILAGDDAASEAEQLHHMLPELFGVETSEATSESDVDVSLSVSADATQMDGCTGSGGYVLQVDADGIRIRGNDAGGLFYGIQSVIALIDPDAIGSAGGPVSVPFVDVVDCPRFPYRGLMIDVARHFHPTERIEQTIRLMSFYKLNKMHFHLSDDEGWRLPVAALPELTSVGARRGHTLDSHDLLPPSFGSGPDPESSPGSGYYTRAQFIDLLRFAARHHVDVIPEIDSPGHMRAAIKSMEHRYRKLIAEGRPEDAVEFLLTDFDDASVYRSVQGWNDNVANVCLESTYRFMETVIDELISLYDEAGAPLTMIHLGGDEVPPGVWQKSPACNRLLASRDDLNDVHDLSADFYRRLVEYLERKGLKGAGWEEIGLEVLQIDGVDLEAPKPDLAGKVIPYAWNSVWGWGGEERAYKLANAGYQVVMANAPNLYFDLAAEKHPKDPGFAWAGFVDSRKAFEMTPMDIYNSAYDDLFGHPIDPVLYRDAVRLTPEGTENILGVQAQLWGENTPSKARFEYHLYPKILALAERAWTAQPVWETVGDRDKRLLLLNADWNRFANSLGQRELLRLAKMYGGVGYRIPPAGAIIVDDMLHANVALPGLEVRYTTDGSEPTSASPRWTVPVRVDGPVKIRAFDATGRGSRTEMVVP